MTTRKKIETPTLRSGWISSKPTRVSLTLHLSPRRPETGGLCWLLPPGETAGLLSGCWSMKSSLRHSAGGPTLCNNICPCACVGACKHLIEPVQMHWREHCLSVIKYCSSYHLMVTSNASFNLQSKVYHVIDSLTRELLMASTLHISVSEDLEGARLNKPVLTSAQFHWRHGDVRN